MMIKDRIKPTEKSLPFNFVWCFPVLFHVLYGKLRFSAAQKCLPNVLNFLVKLSVRQQINIFSPNLELFLQQTIYK